MLPFNEEFQNETSKISKVWVDLELVDGTSLSYDETRVNMNGFVRDSSTTVDGQFTVGAAVTGKLTVVLDNSDDVLSPYDFRGATLVAWLGGILSDNTEQKVNVGRYYVDQYTYDGNNVTLVGYDDMIKFDIPFSGHSYGISDMLLTGIIRDACSDAGITLYNDTSNFPNGSFYINNPGGIDWDTMTGHDVIAYAAQIACCYAHIVYVPNPGDYRLKFEWYDMSQFTSNQYDGGTFDTTSTPYSDGASLDGGTFDPWSTGDVADGGSFGDRSGVHIIGAPYDLTTDTDDVQITGVSVTLEPSDNTNATDSTQPYTKTLGTEGYIISTSGNPLVRSVTATNALCTYLYNCLNGMRFRPLNASVVEDPSMEAGDVAYITGRGGNTYACFLSRVTYTVNAATQISCDAESSMQSLKGRYTQSQKTSAMIRRIYESSVSDAETEMGRILGALATTMGLYNYSSTSASGTTYLFGNKNTLNASDIRWRFTAGALTVSSDYGAHWNAALSANGIAVLQEVYAVKVNADYIVAGDLTLGGTTKNTDGHFYLKDASGNLMVTMDKYGIYHGKTGISDTTHTGFYLNDDGFIIGDGTTARYAKITPDGTVYIHDNLYYGQEEAISPDPSFIVEGVDANGTAARTSIMSEGIETTGDITADKTIYSPVISNLYGELIACSYSQVEIKHLGIQGYEDVVSNPYVFIGCEGTSFGVYIWESDRKLKKNINDSTVNALDHVNKIRHRSFELKRNGAKVDNGYVAQEIENVIPGSVFDVPQPDGTTKKQINEAGIIPYLSKAIQELSAKVDALEARVAELEGK